MIERHITFSVHPDQTAEFERFFAESTGRRSSPCPASSSARSCARPSTPTATRWSSAGRRPSSAVAWRMSEVHQALQPALNALHSGMEIVAYSKVA